MRIAVAWSSKVGQFAGTSLDHEFAEAGLLEVEVPNATSPTLRGLATVEVNFRGEIYIIGDAAFGTKRKTFVAKIDEEGKYVSDFGTDGFVVIDYEPLDKEVGFDLWLDGDGIYLLFLSLDAGESAALRGKLHAARIWR